MDHCVQMVSIVPSSGISLVVLTAGFYDTDYQAYVTTNLLDIPL